MGRSPAGNDAFKDVLLGLEDHSFLKSVVEEVLDLFVGERRDRLLDESKKIRDTFCRKLVADAFEGMALPLRQINLVSDADRNEGCIQRPRFPALARDVDLDQGPQSADQHLVASTEDKGRVIPVSFHECRDIRSAHVASQEDVVGPGQSVGQFFTGNGVGHADGECILVPELTDQPAGQFSRTEAGRVVFGAVNDSHTGLTRHEAFENRFSVRPNTRKPQGLFDHRIQNRKWLRLTDQRIPEALRMHLHADNSPL